MSGVALATVDEVVDRFRPLSDAERALAGVLLVDASKILTARFPDLDARAAGGTLDPALVAMVAANMVIRVLRNPGGVRAESVGPMSVTYDVDAARRLLYLEDGELALLAAAPPTSTVPARSIRLRPGLQPHPRAGGWDVAGWW